ncbi:MAG: hypothetical protein U1E62_21835 [Alsobacter sp.]
MRVLIACSGICWILATQASLGHTAPSGWLYDPSCCGGQDCRQITDDSITPVPGGWRIEATGEIISSDAVKHSPDDHFHRCSRQGVEAARTICLYVPDMS